MSDRLLLALLDLSDAPADTRERIVARAGEYGAATLYRRTAAQRVPPPYPFDHALLVRHTLPDGDHAATFAAALDRLHPADHAIGDYVAINARYGTAPSPPPAIQLSLTSPRAGQEETFERWYAEHHFPDGMRLPGFAAGQRFRRLPSVTDAAIRMAVLAAYELDTADIAPSIEAIASRVGSDRFRLTDSIDPHYWAWFFAPVPCAAGRDGSALDSPPSIAIA